MNQRLINVLAKIFAIREAEVNLNLRKEDVGSWDSLKQMDLVILLENEYEIALDITDIIQMVSVATIIEVLKKKGVTLED